MKTVINIIAVFCLIFTAALASASGFLFTWESIVAEDDFTLEIPGGDFSIKNHLAPDAAIHLSEDSKNLLSLHQHQEITSKEQVEAKSAWDKIKVSFSASTPLLPETNEFYSRGDDEQLSKFMGAMTSLIYDDSKTKSLETIGKIIEPQINFYFSF
jgi:hypothetical protein